MRIRVVWGACCLVLLAMMGACSKSSEADKLPPMEFEGVKVDTPRLMAEFVSASPQVQRPVSEAVTKMRYKKYLEAMMDLDQVLKSTELNDKQKKLTAQVIDQLKDVLSKAPSK